MAAIAEVPETHVRAVVLHDEDVEGRDAAVLGEADLGPALEAGAAGAEQVFFLAADPHHDGTAVGLLRQMRRDRHDRIRVALRAEAAAAELGDEHDLLRLDPA